MVFRPGRLRREPPLPVPDPLASITPRPVPREEREFYITFPAEGGTQTFGPGDLLIDFLTGEVRLPNNTSSRTSDKLGEDVSSISGKFMRSFFCEPDQDVDVFLDDMGEYTFPGNALTGIIFQNFQRATIRATVSTTIKVFASTDPRGGLVRG